MKRGLDRIIGMSDAIFAFSLTLLAADLIVPDLSAVNSFQASNDLIQEIPRFLYFLLTFMITWAYFWSKHHRVFRFIRRYDDVLIRLNMFFLLFILLMPFITKVINEHSGIQIAVIIAALGYAARGIWQVSCGTTLQPITGWSIQRSRTIMSKIPLLRTISARLYSPFQSCSRL